MSDWQAVLTTALIGTERAVVPPPSTSIPSDGLVAGPDPAGVLLDRAALLTAARRAGRLPEHAEPPPAPPLDQRRAVSPAAARRLARILSGDNGDLVTEWLAAAVARELRPPPQSLPVLLDRARRVSAANADPDEARFRGLVAAAGGSRARWLAGLNPAWAYLLTEPVPASVPPPAYLSATQLADVLSRALRELSQSPLTAHRAIRLAGRRADPALGAPGAMADFPPEAPNVLHNMVAVLRFRWDMIRELGDAEGA